MSQNAEHSRLRLELSQAASRAEAAAAQRLIDAFVATAKERKIPTVPLRATLISGHVVKTDKVGWYIRANQSVAIGEDGAYYQLVVPGSRLDRFRGVKLTPTPPPLVVNRGGRDGDSGDLSDFLAWRLAQ